MAGLQTLVPLIPPVLLGSWAIFPTSGGTQTLHDCRIIGSTDPTYGTIGPPGGAQWLPPTDGSPWAVIGIAGVKEDTYEPNRIRAIGDLQIFLAIEDAETPAQLVDFHDRMLAWQDSLRQVVASNRRLLPGSLALYPTAGDVRWELPQSAHQPAMKQFGGEWYGVSFHTQLSVTISVNYQF